MERKVRSHGGDERYQIQHVELLLRCLMMREKGDIRAAARGQVCLCRVGSPLGFRQTDLLGYRRGTCCSTGCSRRRLPQGVFTKAR